nr:multiple inositol polyphosphate phosphatase 1-like isoform X2 [Tanacetum cinerariifolium]
MRAYQEKDSRLGYFAKQIARASAKKETKSSLEKVPSWLLKWSSHWKGKIRGEELISQGEDEMYHLGKRIMERFHGLFTDEYHPGIYQIRVTQVGALTLLAYRNLHMVLFNVML